MRVLKYMHMCNEGLTAYFDHYNRKLTFPLNELD